MWGEEQSAKQVLVSYVSAQLQSSLVAIEAALNMGDHRLSFEAAKKYIYLAEIARQLYTDPSSIAPELIQQSHNWGLVRVNLEALPGVSVKRKRRLPRVFGEANMQSQILQTFIQQLSPAQFTMVFRQRGDDLVMCCQGTYIVPDELVVAGSKDALSVAARKPSMASIRGYLLSRRCEAAGMRIMVVRGLVYFHFRVIRQLKIPLEG